jgi:hypothetical protein
MRGTPEFSKSIVRRISQCEHVALASLPGRKSAAAGAPESIAAAQLAGGLPKAA